MAGVATLAPNFTACSSARNARSAPARPVGKPRKFSIRDEAAAWPPIATSSRRTVRSPSEAP